MKFRLVFESGGATHSEPFDVPGVSAEAIGRRIVQRWNDVNGANPATFVRVEVPENPSPHWWEEMRGGSGRYRCVHCGATGRRIGNSEVIDRDSAFRGREFYQCRPVRG